MGEIKNQLGQNHQLRKGSKFLAHQIGVSVVLPIYEKTGVSVVLSIYEKIGVSVVLPMYEKILSHIPYTNQWEKTKSLTPI